MGANRPDWIGAPSREERRGASDQCPDRGRTGTAPRPKSHGCDWAEGPETGLKGLSLGLRPCGMGLRP
eukprot:2712942-Alexandrium_andersonii.AAC.1